MQKATRQQSKRHNSRLVLKMIYETGAVSRADIARATRLTRPTVSTIVTELMKDKFVVETGQGPSAGGKRPTLLNIANDAYQLLAVDLGSEIFRGSLINMRGVIQKRVTFARHGATGDAALALTMSLIDTLLGQASAPILGIGIGTPGLINPSQGVIKQAVNLNWYDMPLRQTLAGRFHLPVYVANDSHMAALAEYMFGADFPGGNLILIKVGRGIGAGIVLDGQLFYGDGYGAGEVGHVVVSDGGPLCTCGNHGCLETLASTRAILTQAESAAAQNSNSMLAVGRALAWEDISAAVKDGDAAATVIVDRAGRALGTSVANLIGGLHIHHIVIAGRVTQFGLPLLQAAQEECLRRVLPAMAAETSISYSTLGSDIVMLGSSAMILNQELGII